MTLWNQVRDWIESLFASEPVVVPPPTEAPSEPLRPRVLLITYNPTIRSEAGRKLAQVLGWHDTDGLCQEYIADLRECSDGFVDFEIVERIEVDAFPVKEDGFRYDAATYLRNWRSGRGWHDPDRVDYGAILTGFDLLKRITLAQVDEVWLFGFPFAGFYESRMVGPGASWCNSPPIQRDDVPRRFVIMGFNYERGVGPMLESFGHRVESHLDHVWRNHSEEDNLWKQFIRYDKIAPGQANCGNVHFAPNSVRDYDWGNPAKVPSNCDDWLNFPNFQGTVRQVDRSEWGNGDMRAHHKWWFKHLPKAPGKTHGISNNWWWYAVDPNALR